MTQNDTRALEQYLSRIRPIYHQLFNLAHAVTGSSEAAAYCLQYAMLQGWIAGEGEAGQHGFREALRRFAVRAALKCDLREQDWAGFEDVAEADPLYRLIAQENPEMQRVLALHFGCGLSMHQAAKIMDTDARRISAMLRRFEARAARKLQGRQQRLDRRITHVLRQAMNQESPLAPEMGASFRSFQADAAESSRPSRLPMKIIQWIIAAVLAVMCIAAFWFAAVILQPPVMEEPVQIEQMQE